MNWPRFAQIERFRLRKTPEQVNTALRMLVKDSSARVPSIQRRLEQADISPCSIQTTKDLIRIPVGNRTSFDPRHIARYLRNGTNIHRCYVCTTSGTTGQQFAVYMSRSEAFYRRLMLFSAIRKNAHLRFPFSIAGVGFDTTVPSEIRRFGVGCAIRLSRLLPFDRQIEILLRSSPQVITGFPTCLELLAERLREQRQLIRPLLVVSSGEELQPHVRSFLAASFGCRVVDYYSCEEVGNVAWECPNDSSVLHVQTDACILEVVDNEGVPLAPGTEGNVVITNLFNYTMPLIRYSLGDRAVMKATRGEACICGYRGVSLSAIEGREEDFFIRKDGHRISPRMIATLMSTAVHQLEEQHGEQVQRYQVTQEESGEIRVHIVVSHPIDDAIAGGIASSIQQLGLGAVCTIEQVLDIPSEPSGKFRRFVSHIS